MNRIKVNAVIGYLFYTAVILIAIYALGFFTNLMQIRGAERQMYDLYQGYVRQVFNLSLGGIVLMIFLRSSGFRLTEGATFLHFVVSVVLVAGVVGISLYSLLKMPGFHGLYQGISVEDVQLFYPNYRYNDKIFSLGYVLFSYTGLSGILFFAALIKKIYVAGGVEK